VAQTRRRPLPRLRAVRTLFGARRVSVAAPATSSITLYHQLGAIGGARDILRNFRRGGALLLDRAETSVAQPSISFIRLEMRPIAATATPVAACPT